LSLPFPKKVIILSKYKISHPDVISTFVSYDKVPAYLYACDIGIIWRDENIVNWVASPIKFSEYLSCGLPVIANRSVHLINEVIENYKVGVLIKDISEINKKIIESLLSLNRYKISEVGRYLFGIENVGPMYLKIYNKILKEKL